MDLVLNGVGESEFPESPCSSHSLVFFTLDFIWALYARRDTLGKRHCESKVS